MNLEFLTQPELHLHVSVLMSQQDPFDARLDHIVSAVRTVADDSYDNLSVVGSKIDETKSPAPLTLMLQVDDVELPAVVTWSRPLDKLTDPELSEKLTQLFLNQCAEAVESLSQEY